MWLLKTSSFKLRLAYIIIFLIFLGLGVKLSTTLPFSTGPDEVAHFQLIRFVAKYGRLPVTWAEKDEAGYKSGWPPLFHGLAGMSGRNIDLNSPPFIKIAQNNPRLQLVVGQNNIISWRALKTEDPYQSEVLLWYLGRWVTLACGAVGIGAIYWLLRRFYPPWLALSAAALLAFMPIYFSVSSVISYEPLLGVILTFYLGVLFYLIQHPTQNWLYGGAGLLLGLACLTKYTPLPTIPILPLFILWLAYRQHWHWRITLWRLLLFAFGLILTLGSWLFYTELYFNRVAELGWINGLLSPLVIQADYTSQWFVALLTGGQAASGHLVVDYNDFFRWLRVTLWVWGDGWLAWIFLGVWGVALAGLIVQWRRGDPSTRQKIILLSAHIGLFIVFPLARFLADGVNTGMGQHFLFPAGSALIFLLVLGWRTWLSPARLAGLLFILAGVYLTQDILLAVQPSSILPIQTVPLAGGEKVLATIDEVSLIGYQHVANDQALEITLNWRTEALMAEDYRLELTLLDVAGKPQARWIGQPLQGVYPTRAWAPGDRLRDLIQVPIAGLAPGDYQVQLRWLGETAPRTPVQAAGQTILTVDGDKVKLGHVSLAPAPIADITTVLLNGQEIGYKLWPSSQATLPRYSERATITFLTRERLAEEIRVSLVGPDGQPHQPLDHTGHIYNFYVEPRFVSGDYHLRFEQSGPIAQLETPPLLQIHTQPRQFTAEAIPQPVKANFAGYVALLGYAMPQSRVKAGDKLPVTLYWQALKTIGADLVMFNHIINDQQQVWGKIDRRPRDIYSTMLWATGEVVVDSYEISIDANAPDGIYHLLAGCYLPMGQASISLPLMQDGQLTKMTNINLGHIKIGRTPPGLTRQSVTPQYPLNQSFGDPPNLTLLGYDLTDAAGKPLTSPDAAARLSSVRVVLYWRAESPLPIDYTTFVHLRRHPTGETVAQKDQPPLKGAYPTSLWDAGEIVVDEIAVPLPSPLPAGDYKIVVGMYDFKTGQRLTVPGSPANEVILPIGGF